MSGPADESAYVQVQVSLDHNDWRDITPPVRSVDIEDSDTQTDKAVIVLDDNHEILGDASMVGLEVRVALGWNSQNAILFEGEITESRNTTSGSGQRVQLTAYDFSYRLTREARDQTWTSPMTLSQVLAEIIGRSEYGLSAGQIQPDPDAAVGENPPLRQRNVNDWQFICELARRNNSRCFVEFNASRSQFYFLPIARIVTNDPLGALTYCRGVGSLLEFQYQRVGSGAAEVLSSATMNPESGETVTRPGETPSPAPPSPPPRTADRASLTASQRTAVEALAELSTRAEADLGPRRRRDGGGASDPAVAERRLTRDPTRELGLSGSGVAIGNVNIRAKGKVSITGIAPWAEGDWYLNKVNHVFSRERLNEQTSSSYRTRIQGTR